MKLEFNSKSKLKLAWYASIVILLVGVATLSQCLRGSAEQRAYKCYIKEMKGQGEHMSTAVSKYCASKYGLKIRED